MMLYKLLKTLADGCHNIITAVVVIIATSFHLLSFTQVRFPTCLLNVQMNAQLSQKMFRFIQKF